ncbi:MAG: undecaprenyl-phosphate galactose phosphotransferase WbaP [Desulfovibrio sp.]|jgi:Undecaprenyl-phosphate galactose phosphotransferase WbaP|nr:undecaprenyl-phosphate galactose phosphotransferase WbaP [Desulfovibrio sp.]
MESKVRHRRFPILHLAVYVLIVSDMLAVSLSFCLGFFLRGVFPSPPAADMLLALTPALLLFPLLYAAFALYPGNWLHPAEEIKLLTRGTTIGFCLLAAAFFLLKSSDSFSRAFFLLAWVCALILTPLARYGTRLYCDRFSWWKIPIIIAGRAKLVREARDRLANQRRLGVLPVAMISLCPPDQEPYPKADPCPPECPVHAFTLSGETSVRQEGRDLFSTLAERYQGAILFLLLRDIPPSWHESLLHTAGENFYRIFLAPAGAWCHGVPDFLVNLGGSFVLSMRRNLNDRRRLRLKRACDLSLSLGILLLALPLLLCLALCIRLDSPGPVLFRHRRIGGGGKPFTLFKFRTMRVNADALLQSHLAEHPEKALEWNASQKLRHDPRVTRLGHFLRRTSLDELPQLFNVLRGEMSLVGPRPIVEAEIARYGRIFSLYTAVLPGITGLWQVSGRNDCSYTDRISLDRDYVLQWSVWLDIFILIKTVPVVLGRRGAY